MFAVYGPGFSDRVRVPELLTKPLVRAASAVMESQAVNNHVVAPDLGRSSHPSLAEQAYQQSKQRSHDHPILYAKQIMTTPVTYLTPQSTTAEALHYFEAQGFRHLPVVASEQGALIGMLSDRDLLRCMCAEGIFCKTKSAMDGSAPTIEPFMQTRVLAARMEADARYIARLFVEKRIGAVPIVDDDGLVGIVTRSDVLRAVMVHFDLSFWS